jgi:hypothetical protein
MALKTYMFHWKFKSWEYMEDSQKYVKYISIGEYKSSNMKIQLKKCIIIHLEMWIHLSKSPENQWSTLITTIYNNKKIILFFDGQGGEHPRPNFIDGLVESQTALQWLLQQEKMRYKRGEYNTTAHEQNKDKTWHIKLITADCWLVLPPNNVLTDSFVPLASYTALLGCNIFSNNLTKSFYFPRAVPCLGYNCVWSMKLASYDYSHWSWPDPLKPFILNWSLKTRSTLLHQLVLL